MHDPRPKLLPGALRLLGYAFFVGAGTCFCLALLCLAASLILWVEFREPGGLVLGARLAAGGLAGVLLGILAHALEVRARRGARDHEAPGPARVGPEGAAPETEALAALSAGAVSRSAVTPVAASSEDHAPESELGTRQVPHEG